MSPKEPSSPQPSSPERTSRRRSPIRTVAGSLALGVLCVWLAVPGLLGSGLSGCAGSPPSWRGAPLVLISIDTLRADRLPTYGYDAVSTPAIETLARDGVVFEQAFSHVPLTLPSHLSIFTGLLPHRHGVRSNAGYAVRLDGRPYLTRRLAEAGYATGASVSAFPLSRPSGFGEGFDFFDDADGFAQTGRAHLYQRPGSRTLEAALPWLRQAAAAEDPFFFFLHLFEPHMPYDTPTADGRSPYDAEVATADHLVGALLEELRELGVYDRAVVVLLSDHGEGLGDHGETEHGMLLYREVLHVPLLVKLPNNAAAGRRIAAPAALTDVAPTILELLGLEPFAEGDGRSQASAIFGRDAEDDERTIFAETLYPRLEMGWSELFSVARGGLHLIRGPRPELYDRSQDPGETRDLLAGEPSSEARRALADLGARLDDLGADYVPAGEVSSESEAALAALGYVGTSAGPEDPSVSPRERIHVYEIYRAGQRAFTEGDWATAEVRLREALEEDPEIIDAWLLLGSALDRLGRPGDALEAYLRGGPVSDRAVEIASEVLGLCRNLNRLYLCADHLAVFVDAQPTLPRLRYLHARTLRELGRKEEALASAEAALELAPEDPDAHYLRGTVLAALNRLEEAQTDLRRALDMTDENHLPALVDLAMVLHQQGRQEEEARRLLELARFADPDDPSVLAAAEALGVE